MVTVLPVYIRYIQQEVLSSPPKEVIPGRVVQLKYF